MRIVYSTIYLGADQREHQSSTLQAFVQGIHRWPVNSPHKGPVTWKMFPFDDIIMTYLTDVNTACATLTLVKYEYEAGDLKCHHAHYDVIVMAHGI